jgi:hypothetical protein
MKPGWLVAVLFAGTPSYLAADEEPGDAGQTRSYEVRGRGTVELTVPPSWKDSTTLDEGTFTIEFSPPSGSDFLALISILPQQTYTEEWAERSTRESLEGIRDSVVEESVPLKRHDCAGGAAFYYSVTDRNPTPEPGDYTFMMQGVATLDGLGVTFTTLTDEPDSPLPRQMLSIISSARAALQDTGARYDLKLPGKEWAVSISIAGYAVQKEETSQDGNTSMMMASNEDSGMMLSLFLERERKDLSSESCRKRYFEKSLATPSDKTGVRRWDERAMALGEYTITSFEGTKVRNRHVHAYLGKDGVCMDLHLSKGHFEEDDGELFDSVISSVQVVPADE